TKFFCSSGAHALQEAFNFFSTVKKYGVQLGHPVQADTRVLDFGCGWGRILRFFFKDCEPRTLYRVAVAPEVLAPSRPTKDFFPLPAVDPLPPTSFADESFDLVTAY